MNLEIPDAPQERIPVLLAEVAKAAMELGIQHQNGAGGPERWLKTPEACEYLGISRMTLFRYQREGKLHPAKMGNMNRYSTRELDALPEIIQKGSWK